MSTARLLHDAAVRLENALARLSLDAANPLSIELARVSVDRALMDIRSAQREVEIPHRRVDDIVLPEFPRDDRRASELVGVHATSPAAIAYCAREKSHD